LTLPPIEEVRRTIGNVCGTTTLASEDCSYLSAFYGLQELLSKRPMTFATSLDALAAVTAEDIRGVARDVLRTSKFHLAVVSPLDDPAPFLKLAERLGG
jgi:predicted Zn-dependent peptidase